MGKKPGPPKLDAAVIELRGNRSKLTEEELAARREEEAKLKPKPLRPTKPAWLSKYAAECWDLHAPELERMALLTKLDAGAFALACESFALARTALEELRPRRADGEVDQRKKGLTTTEVDRVHGGMLKRHPAAALYLQASGDYRRWCDQFGLTPSARLGLRPARSSGSSASTTGGAGDDGDGSAEFLGY